MGPVTELTPVQKQKLLLSNLMKEKEELESKIKENIDDLNNLKVGVSMPLVDEEGFPIANLDHYNIRKLRGEVNVWTNDMKVLMRKIEEEIHVLHKLSIEEQNDEQSPTSNLENNSVESSVEESSSKENKNIPVESKESNESNESNEINRPNESQKVSKESFETKESKDNTISTLTPTSTTTIRESNRKPFLYVAEVHSGSPAFEAGLIEGDLITLFGTITSDHVRRKGMGIIASLVEESLNKPLDIEVRRKDSFILLKLVPHTWDGRGFLGCLIRPYDS